MVVTGAAKAVQNRRRPERVPTSQTGCRARQRPHASVSGSPGITDERLM